MAAASRAVTRRTTSGSGSTGGSTAGRSNPSRWMYELLVDGRWNIVRPFCRTRPGMDPVWSRISVVGGSQMSHKLTLSDLQREGPVSMTQQLVDRFVEAIETVALEPGEKLPTTRALAAEAGVNHLTAA